MVENDIVKILLEHVGGATIQTDHAGKNSLALCCWKFRLIRKFNMREFSCMKKESVNSRRWKILCKTSGTIDGYDYNRKRKLFTTGLCAWWWRIFIYLWIDIVKVKKWVLVKTDEDDAPKAEIYTKNEEERKRRKKGGKKIRIQEEEERWKEEENKKKNTWTFRLIFNHLLFYIYWNKFLFFLSMNFQSNITSRCRFHMILIFENSVWLKKK